MKPTSQSITNPELDSHTLLGTLPANPPIDSQSKLNHVPKGHGDLVGYQPKLLTVKDLARLYGLKMGAIYEFIKTEPDFPYVNVGVKKKFLIDVSQFETWLMERTKKQKHEHFAIPTALDLATVFKNKPLGVNK